MHFCCQKHIRGWTGLLQIIITGYNDYWKAETELDITRMTPQSKCDANICGRTWERSSGPRTSVASLSMVRLLPLPIYINFAFSNIKRPLSCLGVKLGLWHWGRNVGWGCLRTGCWGEYLGLRGTRQQGNGENYIMRSLGIFTPYPILCGW